MTQRRPLSFGRVAAAYERYRPDYPDRLVTDVLAYADPPVRTVLEIGAGTGKATRTLARHGLAVTATDPDAAMLARLRAHVPSSVTVVQAAFEQISAPRTHDLVLAAAALHWTEPDGRWTRVAALLRDRGTFACVGGPPRLADPGLDDAVRSVRSTVLPDDDVPSPDGTPADHDLQWPGTELIRSDLFTDVRQTAVERRLTLSRDEFVGYLSTVSAYLSLADAERSDVLDRIRAVLPAQVQLVADLVLHLARRA